MIRVLDVPMQRGGVELRQQKDAVDVGIDAITDRYIDQPVFARERDGRLAAFHCERVETSASASAHDDSDHVFWGWHNCRPKPSSRFAEPRKFASKKK